MAMQTVTAGTTLSATEAATLSFVPAADFSGSVTTVNYTITDSNGNAASATIDITVTPTPDAIDDAFTGPEDAPFIAVDPITNGVTPDDAGAGFDGTDDVTINTIPPAAAGTLTYFDGVVTQTVTAGTQLSATEAATLRFVPTGDFNGAVTPISYTITDSNGNSDDATIRIAVTPVNDPPALDLDASDNTVAGTGYLGTFTEDGPAVPVADADTVVTDVDDSNLERAVIALTNPQAGDALSVVAASLPAGISIDAANTTAIQVTLTGSASVADYQAAIEAIRFANRLDNPSTVDRLIDVTVNDGDANSNTARSTIEVDPVNDPPAVDLDASDNTAAGANYEGTFTEDGGAVPIADVDTQIADPDDSNVVSAIISLTNPKFEDALSVLTSSLPAGIAVDAANTNSNQVTLVGSATRAEYQTAIEAVRFNNTSDAPDTTNRVINVTVNDGDLNSNTAVSRLRIQLADDPITLTGTADDGAIAGTDGLVEESDLNDDGSTPAGTDETVSGTFTVSAPDGLTSITVGGTVIPLATLEGGLPVVIAPSSNAATPDFGTITITRFNSATGDVTYSYTLASDVDHSGGALSETIALAVTDAQGDTETGGLKIAIVDDLPSAQNDTDTAINVGGNPSSVATGNIVTGNDTGSPDPDNLDGIGDTIGADENSAPVTGVMSGTGGVLTTFTGSTVVTSGLGQLTIGDDGSYSYTPDFGNAAVAALGPNDSLTDIFTYQLTDGDGDHTTATLTITITGGPAVISAGTSAPAGVDATVLEAGLSTGTNAAGTGEIATGTFRLVAPNGLDRITLNGAGNTFTVAQLQAATPGAPLVVTTAEGTLEIIGATDFGASGPNAGETYEISYRYTLSGAQNHSGGQVFDEIAIALTDDFQNTADGILRVEVIDDAPIAVNDIDSVVEDGTGVDAAATGNVITGTDAAGGDGNASDGVADNLGADRPANPVTAVGAGAAAPTGAVGTAINGTFGQLVLQADGSYVYTPDNSNLAVQGLGSTESVTDTFTYEIIDSDGDSRTTTLVITINGSDDPITIGGTGDGAVAGTDATVLESDLVSGSNAAGTGESLSGAFTIAVPDGLQSITVGGTNISAAALNNSAATPVTIPSPTYGTIVINGYNSTSGEVSYTYTLDTFADHRSVDRDTIALTVTDADSQTQNATLAIAIGDDRPVAADDSATGQTPGTAPTITVLTNDATGDPTGLDAASVVITSYPAGTMLSLDGKTLTVPGEGQWQVNGSGQITFTPEGGFVTDPTPITYTVNGVDGGVSNTANRPSRFRR